MARLALQIAGGIIGALLALPTGGISVGLGFALGSLAGSIVGTLAFPGKGTHVYGPRVNDMQIGSSAPGTVIPLLFGSMRLGGQIIWSPGLQEVTNTTKQSSKGAPSVTQTSYTYFCSFAAAFCQGPATITRCWGDSKLIFDITGKGQVAKGLHTFPTRYNGSDTQLPDPVMVAKNGVNLTPAYRGTCYAVWEKFPLANFGNRLPNIRGEVTAAAPASFPGETIPWDDSPKFSPVVNPFQMITSYDGHTAFVFSNPPTENAKNYFVNRINLDTNATDAVFNLDPSTLPNGYGVAWISGGGVPIYESTTLAMAADVNGDIWVISRFDSVSPNIAYCCYDGWTGKGKKVCAVPTFSPGGTASLAQGVNVAYDGQSIVWYHNAPGSSSGHFMVTVRVSDATVVGHYLLNIDLFPGDVFAQLNVDMQFPILDPKGNAYIIGTGFRENSGGPYVSFDWYIFKINMPSGVNNLADGVYTNVERHTFTGDNTTGCGYAALYDGATDSLIVYTRNPAADVSGGDGIGCLHKINCSTMQITDTLGDAAHPAYKFLVSGYQWKPAGAGVNVGLAVALRGRTNNGIFYAPDPDEVLSTRKFISYNTSHFAFEARYDYLAWGITSRTLQTFVWDFYNNSFIAETDAADPFVATYRFYLDRLSTNGDTAASIVRRLCELCGIDDSDIDVSLIEDLSVGGYPITSLSPAKDMINTLGQALFFEGRESDFRMQFIPRGLASQLTLAETELGLVADKAKLTETVGREQDVPKDVEVIFINRALDYQQDKQEVIRHSATTGTQNKTSISLPLVLTPDAGAALADKILWTAEQERRTYKTNLWKAYYMLLDPCDVIKFNYNGVQLTARIATSTIGQNFASALALTAEDVDSYISTVAGNDSTGFVPQILNGLANTLLILLDIPYLQDQDADASGNTGYYVALGPSTGGTWTAGVVYNSGDNISYNQVDASTVPFAYGIAQNILATPPNGDVFAWDNVSTLIVKMIQGDGPATDSMLNVLNGTNAAILYPSLEIIQFTTATLNGDGTYTLSGLLRGRRGTDGLVAAHSSSETVIFPLVGGVLHEQVSLNLLNLLRYYKGITVGAEISNTGIVQQFTITGNDLKPYAPSGLAGAKDVGTGDWLFSWFRRSRLGGGWMDGTGQVPLDEDTEAYDLEILDSMGNVVRTFAGIIPPGGVTDSWTSPAYPHQNYTAAQQTTDFGGVQTTIRARVYQISGEVGRGFASPKLTAVYP